MHLGGVAATLQPGHGLPDSLHAGPAERELRQVDDRLVADLVGDQTGLGERLRALPRPRPSPRGTTRCDRASSRHRSIAAAQCIGSPDGVAAGQAHRAEDPVGHSGPRRVPGRRCPRHRLVATGREVAERVPLDRSRAAACGPGPRRRPRGCGCPSTPGTGRSPRSSTTVAPTMPIRARTHSGAVTALPPYPIRPMSASISSVDEGERVGVVRRRAEPVDERRAAEAGRPHRRPGRTRSLAQGCPATRCAVNCGRARTAATITTRTIDEADDLEHRLVAVLDQQRRSGRARAGSATR